MRVSVLPYDAAWPAAFATLREELSAALRAVPVVAIEHVGSTSVPGLPAKPVLDVDVVVERAHLDAAITALEAAGYTHEGDLGIPDRHAVRHPDAGRHVYVCVAGALSLRNHLAVRDALSADPALREEYAAVKLALAERELDDMEAYVAGKNDVLQRVLAAAGITSDDLDAILQVNRTT